MKGDDEAGFTVHDKPEVMLDAIDFDHCFVGMPLIGIKIQQGQKLNPHIVEKRREAGAPVADRSVRNFDIEDGTQDEADIAERVFTKVEHR